MVEEEQLTCARCAHEANPITVSFAGYFQLTAQGYRGRTCAATDELMAIHKRNYSNCKETTFWLFYIHNPTKTGGKKCDIAGVESNRREPRKERDWISP